MIEKYALEYRDQNGFLVKKVPLNTKEQVEYAIEKFANIIVNVPEHLKPEFAKNLYEAANEYGVDLRDETLVKNSAELIRIVAQSKLDHEKLAFEIDKRKNLTKHIYGDESKIAKEAEKEYEIVKTASEKDDVDPSDITRALSLLDEKYRLNNYYEKTARQLERPVNAVYKDFEEEPISFTYNGTTITRDKLYKMAGSQDVLRMLTEKLGEKNARKFSSNPVDFFRNSDITYRAVLHQIADNADVEI